MKKQIVSKKQRERLLKDVFFNKKWAWIKFELLEGNFALHCEHDGKFTYRLEKRQPDGQVAFFDTNIRLHK